MIGRATLSTSRARRRATSRGTSGEARRVMASARRTSSAASSDITRMIFRAASRSASDS